MAQVAMYPLVAGGKETTTTADITASDTTLYLTDLTNIPAAPNLVTIKTSSSLWERCRYTARVVTSGVAGYITIERSGDWHASSASGNAALSWGTGAKVLRPVSESDISAIQGNISDHETRVAAIPGYNYIINPAFEINQRANASVNASGGFPVDRWKLLLSGSACVASQQAFTLGQTDVPGEPKNYLRAVVTSSAGSGNYVRITHLIEGVRSLAGRSAILSFYAKADAARPIGVELVQNFGTTGSPSADVTGIGAVAKTLSTGWVKYTVPVTIPSISGKTLGTAGNDYLSVNFWLDAGSTYATRASSIGQQSGTFEFSNVKLEVGGVVTPCVVPRFEDELNKCLRFYEITRPCSSYMFTTYYQSESIIQFLLKKRTIPTISICAKDSNNIGYMRDITSASDISATIAEYSDTHVRVYAASANLTSGHQYGWFARVDAEL